MNTKEHELPHDFLAEKSLIGCVLIDGQSFDDIIDLKFQKEDFYHPKYGVIYSYIKSFSDNN